MIKNIKLSGTKIPVIYSKTITELSKDDPEPVDGMITLGLFDTTKEKIFIAKSLKGRQKYRILIHEIIEAMNYYAELELEQNHTKIVALDSMITDFVLNNRALIREIWKEHDKPRSEDI